MCTALHLIQHATSLGAVESTIERRASIPGPDHLPPALLRLSVGIEAGENLWTDLDKALSNVPEALYGTQKERIRRPRAACAQRTRSHVAGLLLVYLV